MLEISVLTIFIASLLTALATGLGAFPLIFAKAVDRWWLGICNGLAAGLMIGASYGLIAEGLEYGLSRIIAGIAFGVIFMTVAHNLLNNRKDLHVGALNGANAIKALMIVGVMTLHSISEGVGVGVSFGGGEALGELITAAIAIHNIPEGLAISLVLVPRGISVLKSGLWSIFSSLPQPIMAVPAFLFITVFETILPFGLGFAAGAMIWMVFSEIIPDALEEGTPNTVAVSVTLSMTAMLAFQQLLLNH